MAMSGTFKEAMGELYDLYMENRVTDHSTKFYLRRMRHDNGEAVFGDDDVEKILKKLQKNKWEYLDENLEIEEEEVF